MDERRRQRVSTDIRQVLGELLSREVSDSRLIDVTITRVKLSRDGSHASVFFETAGSETECRETCDAMKSASGYLRSLLASRISLRIVPVLSFVHDTSGEKGDRVIGIMRELEDD